MSGKPSDLHLGARSPNDAKPEATKTEIAKPGDGRRVARPSVVEYFRPGEHERVEAVLAGLRELGIERLRTGVSWADSHTEDGRDWYDWLLPKLARNVELLPCFAYTPPSLGIEAKTSAPPRDLKSYADFLDVMVSRHGRHFEWVELWNEPNNINDWDWRLDPQWLLFCTMIGGAAHWMKRRGWKTVLGGMCPTDPHWLSLMCERGIMGTIDAVGVHAFPGTWDADWSGWKALIGTVRDTLHAHGVDPEIWITETGYSTWNHREAEQVAAFFSAAQADAERMYWYSYQDLHGELESQEGFHFDERHYHTGIIKACGQRKLLHRALAAAHAQRSTALIELASRPRVRPARPSVLITGGAGFIGANLADRLAAEGRHVILYDALAREHVEENVDWLVSRHGSRIAVEIGDVRDLHTVRDVVRHASLVYHLAAQVAVTTSVDHPVADFEVNARGTLNVLEAIRAQAAPPPLVFTSTNKVYGRLLDGRGAGDLEERESRYMPLGAAGRFGYGEDRPLDFCSPYGCSKGAADQYVQDYERVFGVPAVVFRMSCIYGPRQFGTEDQGWVAHFVRAALEGRPINIYGDGKQVRDVLFIDDLIEALALAGERIGALSGGAYNIGGGPANAVSLLELLGAVEALLGVEVPRAFRPFRPEDQLYYVSDIRRFSHATGWRPRVAVGDGLRSLSRWLGDRFVAPAALEAHEPGGEMLRERLQKVTA